MLHGIAFVHLRSSQFTTSMKVSVLPPTSRIVDILRLPFLFLLLPMLLLPMPLMTLLMILLLGVAIDSDGCMIVLVPQVLRMF